MRKFTYPTSSPSHRGGLHLRKPATGGPAHGRLFHGKDPGEQIILMTERELQDYEKHLYSIYEKGWHIKIVR